MLPKMGVPGDAKLVLPGARPLHRLGTFSPESVHVSRVGIHHLTRLSRPRLARQTAARSFSPC